MKTRELAVFSHKSASGQLPVFCGACVEGPWEKTSRTVYQTDTCYECGYPGYDFFHLPRKNKVQLEDMLRAGFSVSLTQGVQSAFDVVLAKWLCSNQHEDRPQLLPIIVEYRPGSSFWESVHYSATVALYRVEATAPLNRGNWIARRQIRALPLPDSIETDEPGYWLFDWGISLKYKHGITPVLFVPRFDRVVDPEQVIAGQLRAVIGRLNAAQLVVETANELGATQGCSVLSNVVHHIHQESDPETSRRPLKEIIEDLRVVFMLPPPADHEGE